MAIAIGLSFLRLGRIVRNKSRVEFGSMVFSAFDFREVHAGSAAGMMTMVAFAAIDPNDFVKIAERSSLSRCSFDSTAMRLLA